MFWGFYYFGVDSISEEVAGFSLVFIVSYVLIAVLVILSVKDPNNASLMLKI